MLNIFKKKVTQEELGEYDLNLSVCLENLDYQIEELARLNGYEWTAEGWKKVKKPVKRKVKK